MVRAASRADAGRANLIVGEHLPSQLELEVIWAARHQFDLPQTIRFLLSTLAALDAQGLRPQAVLIEDAANGQAVQQTLKRKVPGLLPVPARGSKESRAHAVAPLLEAGQVCFHHRAAPLVEALPRFPKGSKDLVGARFGPTPAATPTAR